MLQHVRTGWTVSRVTEEDVRTFKQFRNPPQISDVLPKHSEVQAVEAEVAPRSSPQKHFPAAGFRGRKGEQGLKNVKNSSPLDASKHGSCEKHTHTEPDFVTTAL